MKTQDAAIELHSGISPADQHALYSVVRRYKPEIIVEIGMAYGFSTLAILKGLEENGSGKLTSIDPNQTTEWQSIGLARVKEAGHHLRHTLIERPDYLALPGLLSQGIEIDFAYVDGWHTIDYVMLDIFYLDRMLRPEGVIGFNDCDKIAVRRAIKYLMTHRQYRELDVGLPRNYRSRNWAYTAARWLLRWPTHDRYFVKLRSWEPEWGFHRWF